MPLFLRVSCLQKNVFLSFFCSCFFFAHQRHEEKKTSNKKNPRSDIVSGTFKGFALLRQQALGRVDSRPAYLAGYGLVPPTQVSTRDEEEKALVGGRRWLSKIGPCFFFALALFF